MRRDEAWGAPKGALGLILVGKANGNFQGKENDVILRNVYRLDSRHFEE